MLIDALAWLALQLAAPLVSAQDPLREPTSADGVRVKHKREVPKELFEIARVVDGDTLHIRRGAEVLKLRLESVDTEERIASGGSSSSSKPGTVFGEECALWAQEFFAELADEGEPSRIGVFFPDGLEHIDTFGRTLCHAILPDGTDFNLLLVELGKSPYFNKYGNSRCCHAEFVAAQARARKDERGIWNPETNVPKTPGAPSARRPYEKLVPWWQTRAEAVDALRREKANQPLIVDAESPADCLRARQGVEAKQGLVVFGLVERVFEEPNRDLSLLLRCEQKDAALRVVVPHDRREALSALALEKRADEYLQNYLWIRGVPTQGARGVELVVREAAQVELGAPDPKP